LVKTLYKAESDVNYAPKLFKSLLIPPNPPGMCGIPGLLLGDLGD